MAYTAIDKALNFFQPVNYEGTSSGAKTVTGMGFQPAMIWFKQFDTTRSWVNINAASGVDKAVQFDSVAAEHTNANYLASFDSGGFTTGATPDNGTNTSGGDYMAYSCKGGTKSGITTDGSTTITPTAYNFNASSGMSVVQFAGNETSGAKVAHGLGKVPTMMILKALTGTNSGSNGWNVYHQGMGNTNYLFMNNADAAVASTNRWNDTTPDTVNFTLGSSDAVNVADGNMIAYVFADVKGFSKYGVYEGNANVDGAFVYTGFKPAMVAIKNMDISDSWRLFDNTREGFNPENDYVYCNSSSGQSTDNFFEFCSNGFKLRKTDDVNAANTYIYMALGQSIVASNGVTAKAF